MFFLENFELYCEPSTARFSEVVWTSCSVSNSVSNEDIREVGTVQVSSLATLHARASWLPSSSSLSLRDNG